MSKANEVKCESLSLTPWIFNKTRKKKNQPAHKKVVAPMGKMNKIAKKMTQQSKRCSRCIGCCKIWMIRCHKMLVMNHHLGISKKRHNKSRPRLEEVGWLFY